MYPMHSIWKSLPAALAAVTLIAATPAPLQTPTPLRTITHERVTPLCTGLRRSIGPAIGRVLQNDKAIAQSRPLFATYVKQTATNSTQAAQDLDVMRLERLISPLVENTQQIETLLNDPVYPRVPRSEDDRQLLAMRAHLIAVLQQQRGALDVISGFVDTQQLGELQAAGHEYDAAINGTNTATGPGSTPSRGPLAPTPPPSDVLNAGLGQNDISRQYDPRYKGTGNVLGYNPLDVFGNAIGEYQARIEPMENATAKLVIHAIPLCGGTVPGQATPTPKP